MDWISHSIQCEEGCSANITESFNKVVFNYPCTSIFECKPYAVELKRGSYRFELWGSNGGDGRIVNTLTLAEDTGGRGAYVSGVIQLKRKTKFYLYIGAHGEDQTEMKAGAFGRGGFNGGADGGVETGDSQPESSAGGGGSTDIRLVSTSSELDIESLKSRIIVSGAGGGACSVKGGSGTQCTYTTEVTDGDDFLCSNRDVDIEESYIGGAAGTLHGYRTNKHTFSGNQTKGSFGKGGAGLSFTSGSTGGGGSGYFGGTSDTTLPSNTIRLISGAGGSSYVSGCEGCRSVDEEDDEIVTTSDPIHYSKLFFTDIVMKSGLETFNSPTGTLETGHRGNGAIAITLFPTIFISCNPRNILITLQFCFIYNLFVFIK